MNNFCKNMMYWWYFMLGSVLAVSTRRDAPNAAKIIMKPNSELFSHWIKDSIGLLVDNPGLVMVILLAISLTVYGICKCNF